GRAGERGPRRHPPVRLAKAIVRTEKGPRERAFLLGRVVSSGPGPTLRASTRRWTHGRHERSRRAAADRGGGRLVRIPGGHPRAIRGALPGGRALGLGPADAAAPRRQG